MTRQLSVLLFLLFSLACASGNDTLATKAVGGLIPLKSSDIRMLSEDLHISLRQIQVDYVFRNDSSHDIDALVAFPLPVLDGAEDYNVNMQIPEEKATNFLNFQVTSDNKKLPVTVEIKAIAGDLRAPKNITGDLQRLGVSPDVRHSTGYPCPVQGKLREWMAKRELLIIDGDTRTIGCWANWETRIQFVWKQHFRAGAIVRLHQTYKPFLGGGYGSVNWTQPFASQLANDTWSYCWNTVEPASLSRFESAVKRQPQREGGTDYQYREIQYILTTARNWKGPIHDFKLTVDLPGPDDVLVICHPEKKTTPTTYVFEAHDFTPDFNLNLEIFGPNSDIP